MHATLNLARGFHTVQFCANLYQTAGRRKNLFVAVHHQAIAHNNNRVVFVVRNFDQAVNVGGCEKLHFVNQYNFGFWVWRIVHQTFAHGRRCRNSYA